jgi:hypothetical protein
MNIKNKYCLLSELTQAQIDKLMALMADTIYFDFDRGEGLIGFDGEGDAGTWIERESRTRITYKEMLSLLGVKEEEELVPHVHQKEIIAWANGEEIEVRGIDDKLWYPCVQPLWNLPTSYRVKPKLTPTQLRIQKLTEEIVKLKEQDDVECGIKKVMGN